MRAVLVVAVVLVLAFVGLTRTQVGRDGLRDQIEGFVERELQGRLQIGALTGNLLFDLYASDVVLFDADGDRVASVDSIVLRPKWWPLFTRRAIVVDEVLVVRPHVAMHRDSAGTWDLVAALQSKTPSSEPPPALTLRSADIEIEDGTVVTSRAGPAPAVVEAGTLFDFTRVQVTALEVRGALDWTPERKQVEVKRLAARVPTLPLQIVDLEGRFHLDAGRLALDDLRLITGETRAEGTRLTGFAVLESPDERPLAEVPRAEQVLDVRLAAEQVDLDEVRRVVPASPLADAVALDVRADGTLGAVDVRTLRVERGATRIDADGRVQAPEASLDGALTGVLRLNPSTVRQADVAALAPDLDLPDYRHLGTLRVRGEGTATARVGTTGRQWAIESDLAIRTDQYGRTEATVALALAPNEAPAWETDLRLDALDVGGILLQPDWAGALSGRAAVRSIADSTEATLGVVAALASVRAGAVRADTLAADVRIGGGEIAGRVFAQQGASRLDATGGVAALGTPSLAYRLDAAVRALDAQAFYAPAPRTAVTGQLRLDGSGTTLATLRADLDATLSDARVQLGDSLQRIATEQLALSIAPPSNEGAIVSDGRGAAPRLALRSDLADVTLGGGIGLGDLAALGQHWQQAIARTVDAERRKARTFDPATADPVGEIVGREPLPMRPVQLTATLRRPDSLRVLVPGLPALADGTTATVSGMVGTDSLALVVTARDRALVAGALRTEKLGARATVRSRYGRVLTDRSEVTVRARADSVRLGKQMLAQPTLAFAYRKGTGALRLEAQPLYNAAARRQPDSLALGEAILALDFDVQPEATRVTFDEAYLRAGVLHWRLMPTTGTNAPVADLYTDAIVTEGLSLMRVTPDAAPSDAAPSDAAPSDAAPQRLTLAGAFSPARTDTAYVSASGLDLAEVLRFVGLSRPFGGRLDGEVAIPAALGQPELEGDLRIAPFLFDGRPAGEIDLRSRFRPGTTELAVDLTLAPNPDGTTDSLRVPTNDFDVTGTLRLPGRADDGTRTRGAYDLDATFRRLDLFFFDWLFRRILNSADGVASGTGRITGTLTRPLFEADLDVRDASFRVPGFNLAIGLDGEVDVDTEGIHISEARLTDQTGGTGRAAGSILFNDYRFWSFDLEGALREMQIINVAESDALPFYGDIRASGALSLDGPVDNVFLESTNARTTPDSELFIPIVASGPAEETGFLIFADSTGAIPEAETRRSLVSRRPSTERSFLKGLEMQLSVEAPSGSTVHLVLDPATGDVIDAVGRGQMELTIDEGRFLTFGTFNVEGGDYLFTAGDVFTRRFVLQPGGTLRWTGDPVDARLGLAAAYETRASLAGLRLPGVEDPARQRVPLLVEMDLSGSVTTPLVDLRLDLDTGERLDSGVIEALRTELNRGDRQAEYATSVLLTNSFLLAPSDDLATVGDTADELIYTSLSQLVSTRLNLFLNEALASDNVEVLLGVQQGNDFEALDVTYGVALRFLDERLIIRGEGVYQRDNSDALQNEDFQGEVAVEVKLTPDVSLEVFYRRENELLVGESIGGTTFGAYGAGLSYQTEFTSWPGLLGTLVDEAQSDPDNAA
ncbi:MAG: translocation/assembly module TamB domain-containing protein, partial [Bacteroidota bacterium]